jgi:hypothetical protein
MKKIGESSDGAESIRILKGVMELAESLNLIAPLEIEA